MSQKFDLGDRIERLNQLEASGRIKPEHQQELDRYRAQGMIKPTSGAAQQATKVSTENLDRQQLRDATEKAAMERDMLRHYGSVGKAVDDFSPTGTGPLTAALYDAITPDPDGGILDRVGAVIGTPVRALIGQERWAARDHLNTVATTSTLDAAGDMKGAASDRDMALMRLKGVSPYKGSAENKRIINSATYDAGLEQARALVTSDWIAKYGSLSNPNPKGVTHAQALMAAERIYADRQSQRKAYGGKLPKAPPSKRGPITIDIDGRRVR